MSIKQTMTLLIAAALSLSLFSGCTNKDAASSVSEASSAASSETSSPASSEAPSSSLPADSSASADVSVDKILESIAAAYGEDYPADGEIPAEILSSEFGLSPDLYVEAKGQMAMISVNNDRIVVVKAAPDQAELVEKTLLDAQKRKIEDTMQYPANVEKTNASQVVRNGDYVAFLLVGAVNPNQDATPEQAVEHAKAEVQKAVDAFNGMFSK